MLRCYNCSTAVTEVDQARAMAVQLELEKRFADTDYGEALADTSVDNVHCRPAPDQMDANGDIVFCPGDVLTMIFDGLRLGPVARV
jgi:hypothetical protein